MTGPRHDDWPAERVGWYAVSILSLAYVLSYIDRIVLNLLVQPIKADLGISDTQFGALQGVAFGIFYTLMALPLGRLADQYNRKQIIAGGVALFTLFALYSGLARTYTQLFIARIGVGIGEASLTPAAYSIISDYFRPERLGRALSVFTMSAFIGIALAYIFGGAVVGWLTDVGSVEMPLIGSLKPWQLAIILVGLPGLVIAPLVLTVPEPKRRGQTGTTEAAPSIAAVYKEILIRRMALGFMFAGFSMITLSSYASTVWTPAFFIRTFEWSPAEVGLWYGLTYLVVGPAGALLGGWLSDYLLERGVADAPLRVAAYGYIGTGLFGGLAPLMGSGPLALLVFAPAMLLSTLPYPLAGTALQLIAPNRIRGQLSALYLTIINIIGLGAGPLVVGLFSDYVFTGTDGIRYALALVNAACGPLAFVFLIAALAPYRKLRQQMQEVEDGATRG